MLCLVDHRVFESFLKSPNLTTLGLHQHSPRHDRRGLKQGRQAPRPPREIHHTSRITDHGNGSSSVPLVFTDHARLTGSTKMHDGIFHGFIYYGWFIPILHWARRGCYLVDYALNPPGTLRTAGLFSRRQNPGSDWPRQKNHPMVISKWRLPDGIPCSRNDLKFGGFAGWNHIGRGSVEWKNRNPRRTHR